MDVYLVTTVPHLKVRLLRCLLSPGCWCLCLGAGLGDWYLRSLKVEVSEGMMAVLIPVILLVLHVLLVPGVVHPPEVPVPPGHQLSLNVCVLGNLDPRRLGPSVHQHLLLANQVTKHSNYVYHGLTCS